jgi:xylose isomerase
MFYAHIGGMDTFARALVAAQAILDDGEFTRMRRERYESFDSDNGKRFAKGKLSLEKLRLLAHKQGNPEQISGKQEYYENLLNRFV